MPVYDPPDLDKLRLVIVEQWCAPLSRAGVPVRPVLVQGYPAKVIRETADAEEADLVVVGRRGLGGFTELLLGSTSHHLAHHLNRPIVIVP
jgi:nucleotide-binding universal stress UspA family protein